MTFPRITTGTQTDAAQITSVDLAMMRRAIELARQAALEGEVPVGAVVYAGEEIIAEGYNLRETSSDPVAHAELLAISRAGKARNDWRLNDCSLAVTLEPCPMCAGAMVNARVGRVIYGADDPKAGACCSLYTIPTDARLNHEVTVIPGVMADICGQLLRDFFRERREQKKLERLTRTG
ncbi:MAG: tRNA adenosine(34) deaminase TadA [Phycisphaerales bacterium]|nr:tRNA adenosine(34) deaminase TadA [Phycisphaerales bacterium]